MRGFCKERGWPNGNINFPRPIVTEKAFPENEFLILPAISHDRELRVDRALRAAARQAIDVRIRSAGASDDGVGEVDDRVQARAVQHTSGSASSRSGSKRRSARAATAIFEPFISAGTMVRDWYLQGQVKVELPVDRVKADRAIVYNAYLGTRHQRGADHVDVWCRAERREQRARADAASAQRA